MTENEQIRLNEIIFCKLFQKLLKENVNPIKVYDLIEAVAILVGANVTVLNSVIGIILSNDRRYMPHRREHMYLLKKSNVPVRRVCKLAGISPNTYYAPETDAIHIEPRFTPIQYAEMVKIMRFFKHAYDGMEGSVV